MIIWNKIWFIFQGDGIVGAIFDSCQKETGNLGLTLEEVKTEACLNTLESLVGATNDNIDDLFNDVDINNDGLVLESEVTSIMKDMAVDRSSSKPKPKPKCTFKWVDCHGSHCPNHPYLRDLWNYGREKKFDCNGKTTCNSCGNCKCDNYGKKWF